jgi:hypothetical protein
MKTIFKSALLGGALALLLTPLISSRLQAQPLAGKDQLSENMINLGTIQHEGNNKPNKLILIFDSTSLTFEFTDEGELALISTCNTDNAQFSSAASSKSPHKALSQIVFSEQYVETIMKRSLAEKTEEEEEMEIQDWMLHPEAWLKN